MVVLLGLVWGEWPDENLRIIACDVGQGEDVVVVTCEM